MSKHLERARAAAKKKNFEYAAELYCLHLKANPADLEARRELRLSEKAHKKLNGGGKGFWGKAKAKKLELQAQAIRVNKKDPEKTMVQCEELLKQDPDNLVALLRLGESASYANHNEVAVQAFEDALGINKKSKEALRLLGRVHEGTDNLESALKCFQRLNKIDPKDPEAMDKVKKIPATITSKGYQEGSKKGYQGLIDKGAAEKLERQSTRVRTPEQALERISDLEPKLMEDPRDTKTIRIIAELYIKAELPDRALEMCERGLKVDAADYLLSELRGDLLLKRYDDGIKKLKAAFQKNPDHPQVKAKLAKAQQEKLTFEVEEYRRRAEAHPTETGLRFPLGKALFDMGQIDDAIPELQKAKGDPRKKTDAGYYLGQCYIKKKIFKLALKELDSAREEIFEMDDTKKDITYLIARIWEGAGKKDNAIQEYTAIVEADFNYKDATERLNKLSSL